MDHLWSVESRYVGIDKVPEGWREWHPTLWVATTRARAREMSEKQNRTHTKFEYRVKRYERNEISR